MKDYNIKDFNISGEYQYSTWGKVWILVGLSVYLVLTMAIIPYILLEVIFKVF